ncbi:MAG: glycosyltransferase family 4 protein [Candidatus Bathyarchaeota archaeon]|nr:glycosyltransferase family 4 protein [Candidatus Bathyarchaeota archaeon]
MNVLFIMNGIGSVDDLPGISGGDVRWIEVAKSWRKGGDDIHVFTPEAGKRLCERLGLEATFHIFHAPNEYSLKTYLWRFLRSTSLPTTLMNYEGIIYSTTEHFYDVSPALKIKKKNKKNTWVAVVHWLAPLKRKGTSWLNSILFFVNQQMGFHLIKNGANLILAVSENTAEHVKKIGVPPEKIFSVEAGVDYSKIREIVAEAQIKKYDALFMKRFDGTKGVFDIIEIWKEVTRTEQDAKLGMVGLGTKQVMAKLKRMVETYGIKKNVDFLGPIYDFNTKISILASSKLFVLPSYEENWAIVIGEAMAAGVPVLCYNIPEIRTIWKDKIVWVPKGDKKTFADKIIELFNDEHSRNELSQMGMRFVKRYDWHEIAEKEINIITNSAENRKIINK